MRPPLVAFVLLVLLALGIRQGTLFLAGCVEARAVDAAVAVVETLDAGWAGVGVDGLVVRIEGEAPSVAAQTLLLRALREALPLARLDDATTAPAEAAARRPAADVAVLRTREGLTVTGAFASKTGRADLMIALGRAMPGVPIDDLTAVAPPPGPPSAGGLGGAEIAAAVAGLGAIERGVVRLAPGRMRLDGLVLDRAAGERLRRILASVGGPDLALDLRLRVPRRPIAPFRVALLRRLGDPLVVETCATRSTAEAETIEAALAAAGTSAAGACAVGLGGPDVDWPRAALAGIEALADLPAGRFLLEGDMARLDGHVPTSRPAFEAVAAVLEASLPEGVALDSVLEAPPRAGAERPWLSLRREGERLRLAGRVTGEAEAWALLRLARARLGTGAVVAEALGTVAPGAAAPGDERMQRVALAVVRALATAGVDARVEVTAGAVWLTARTPSAGRAARLHRRIAQALPAGVTFESRITVDLPRAVARTDLSPERCAAAAQTVVEARPIGFDPGSAVLDETSAAVIDDLVRVLARCSGARIEIGGHTDDRGDEAMNARLGHARAEAVRVALEARGLGPLSARLSVYGYGERLPVADNATAEGRELNRRIAFRALDRAAGPAVATAP